MTKLNIYKENYVSTVPKFLFLSIDHPNINTEKHTSIFYVKFQKVATKNIYAQFPLIHAAAGNQGILGLVLLNTTTRIPCSYARLIEGTAHAVVRSLIDKKASISS